MTNQLKALLAAPVLCALAACGSASGTSNNTSTPAPATTNGTIVSAVTANPNLGVNVNTIDLWQNSRPFLNLIYGNPAQMQNTAPFGNAQDIPASNLDANGWVKQVPAGYRVLRSLSVPAAGGNIVCHFQGNGTLTPVLGPFSNVTTGAGITTFTVAATNPADWKYVMLAYNVDPSNYIRNIDCREASASTTANIAPEFLTALKGFGLVRFMKWQSATEGNWPVTWATRNKPGDGDFYKNDGVPVEYIVEAANQANADAWVTVPWNADNDYITRFATYVRDNLASGHKVYVETSNEVWNGAYPVYAQACNEAKAEGLLSAEGSGTPGCAAERYAEKTQQVMQIWSTVFAGQMNRLVRVFAWQHVNPYWSDKLLAYMGTSKYVDALATAPYWGLDDSYTGQTLDQVMTSLLPGKITSTLNFAAQQKAIAQKYNLRYIGYEGGQSVELPSNQTLLAQIERDSRMSNLYSQFISGWQSQVGDTLTLFALTGPISQYGAWGMVEYAGQPLSQAPKMSAVASFLGISTATSTTPTTQVCPDGSVIPLTSTCPTSGTTTTTTKVCPDGSVIPLTSTCPTTSGSTSGGTSSSPGQRKGIIKKSATV